MRRTTLVLSSLIFSMLLIGAVKAVPINPGLPPNLLTAGVGRAVCVCVSDPAFRSRPVRGELHSESKGNKP